MMISFYLHSTYLGSMPASLRQDPQHSNSAPYINHYHRAFFCGHCGEVWGRIRLEEVQTQWIAYQRTCRRCSTDSNPYDLAGSFLDPQWWISDLLITNPKLPDAVVRWEFAGITPFIEKETTA